MGTDGCGAMWRRQKKDVMGFQLPEIDGAQSNYTCKIAKIVVNDAGGKYSILV